MLTFSWCVVKCSSSRVKLHSTTISTNVQLFTNVKMEIFKWFSLFHPFFPFQFPSSRALKTRQSKSIQWTQKSEAEYILELQIQVLFPTKTLDIKLGQSMLLQTCSKIEKGLRAVCNFLVNMRLHKFAMIFLDRK